MRTKDFLRSSLLVKERKFIGLMSFPVESFQFVRREILSWMSIREQENSRCLGLPVPSSLDGQGELQRSGGCVFNELPTGSSVEFAVGTDLCDVGAAIRYFHYFIRRDKATGHSVRLTNEGFMTTFLFQENRLQKRVFMWLRLEFCHSSLVRERKIDSTVPRIFNTIRDKCPGVRFEVHAGSSRERIAREWEDALTYEAVAESVRREHRSLARARSRLVQDSFIQDLTTEGSRDLEVSDQAPTVAGFAKVSLLDGLHQAVLSLKDFCAHFFDPRQVPEREAQTVAEAPGEPEVGAIPQPEVTTPSGAESGALPVTADPAELHVRFYQMNDLVDLIDEFERYEGGARKYKRLVIDHFMNVMTSRGAAWLSLVLELPVPGTAIAYDMTLAALRKNPSKLTKQISTLIKRKFSGVLVPPVTLKFTKPVEVRAETHVEHVSVFTSKGRKHFARYMLTSVRVE